MKKTTPKKIKKKPIDKKMPPSSYFLTMADYYKNNRGG